MTESVEAAAQALARLARLLERAAAPLSLADYRALAAILAGEARASRLARRLAVGKPSISATVDSLTRRGLITRERVEADQRAMTLTVTPAGREAFAAAQHRMAHRLGEIAAGTSDAAASLRAVVELGEALERDYEGHDGQGRTTR